MFSTNQHQSSGDRRRGHQQLAERVFFQQFKFRPGAKHMALLTRLALERHAIPNHAPGFTVERIDFPLMARAVIGGVAFPVESWTKLFAAAATDSGGDEKFRPGLYGEG